MVTKSNNDFSRVLNELNSLEFSSMKLGIERIQAALDLFENPESNFKIINIVGTNGKGSTTNMLSKILYAENLKVGTFTSPHLIDVRERICINSSKIPKATFARLFHSIKEKLEKITFFEIITLIAVLYFKENNVDFAIFEAGLGGKFDATNFKTGLITGITQIDLDHTHILGKTPEEIAKDKCGMIKNNSTVIATASNTKKVINIIKKETESKHSNLILTEKTAFGLSMKGEFQKDNAGVAEGIARHLRISEQSIVKGLQQAEWPGRVQFIEKNILLDCAHNPAGIIALKKFITTLTYQKLVIVFGVSSNKQYLEMINQLPEYDELIFTESSVKTRRLELNTITPKLNCKKIQDPISALNQAKVIAEKDDLILVCGSIFLIGDILKKYTYKNTDQ